MSIISALYVTAYGASLTNAPVTPTELPGIVTTKDATEMVLIPAGSFLMGSNDGEPDEKPPHSVELPAYYMDKCEVTHEQYDRFLKASGHQPPVSWPTGQMPPQLARHPVVNVTFDDAMAYARWAGKRLPTEAEWEKAARGATDQRSYPWGNSVTGKKFAVPIGDNAKDHTWPVGSFPDDVSPFGVLDMAGNAWEWTDSWYDAYPDNDRLEIAYGKKYRVIRGGGAIEYYGIATTGRCSARGRSLPYGTFDALGFRCVLSASEYKRGAQ
jgi:formylglycine-generating enzyme required for sulfatase activity